MYKNIQLQELGPTKDLVGTNQEKIDKKNQKNNNKKLPGEFPGTEAEFNKKYGLTNDDKDDKEEIKVNIKKSNNKNGNKDNKSNSVDLTNTDNSDSTNRKNRIKELEDKLTKKEKLRHANNEKERLDNLEKGEMLKGVAGNIGFTCPDDQRFSKSSRICLYNPSISIRGCVFNVKSLSYMIY